MSISPHHNFNATDPRQMLEELLDLGRVPGANPIARQCMHTAAQLGWRREEFLAALAYCALAALQSTQESYLAELTLKPFAMVVERTS